MIEFIYVLFASAVFRALGHTLWNHGEITWLFNWRWLKALLTHKLFGYQSFDAQHLFVGLAEASLFYAGYIWLFWQPWSAAVLWLLYYFVFNVFYHWILVRKEHRRWVWFSLPEKRLG
jgi:CHASE2 domain-containing sensor protein